MACRRAAADAAVPNGVSAHLVKSSMLPSSSYVSLASSGRWDTSGEPRSFLRGAQYTIGQSIPDANACRGVALLTNAIGREIGTQDHLFETDLGVGKSRDFHHYRLGRVVISHVNFPRRVEKGGLQNQVQRFANPSAASSMAMDSSGVFHPSVWRKRPLSIRLPAFNSARSRAMIPRRAQPCCFPIVTVNFSLNAGFMGRTARHQPKRIAPLDEV